MKIGNLEVYGIIYKITNKINGKVYIGQTTQEFNMRYCRKGVGLERVYQYHNSHKIYGWGYNKHLLDSFNKYGLDNFDLDIYFDYAFSEKELNVKEKTYIKLYNSFKNGYNQNLGGEGQSGFEGLMGSKTSYSKPVIQLDKQGNFIKRWECLAQIERELGINRSKTSLVCNKKRKSAGGYIWVFEQDYDFSKDYTYNSYEGYNLEVVMEDLQGNIIKTFPSVKKAIEFTGYSRDDIYGSINNTPNKIKQYKFILLKVNKQKSPATTE